jgi:hypothetical protein
MLNRATEGRQAEQFVVENVRCPSCDKALRELPRGYPLYDVECVRCLFRAQVKRVKAAPRDRIRGGSYDIPRHHLKTGHLLPPMFVCFGWETGADAPQEVWFFPLVPARNLTMRVLSERHATPGRSMAEYIGMRALPHAVVWQKNAATASSTSAPIPGRGEGRTRGS